MKPTNAISLEIRALRSAARKQRGGINKGVASHVRALKRDEVRETRRSERFAIEDGLMEAEEFSGARRPINWKSQLIS